MISVPEHNIVDYAVDRVKERAQNRWPSNFTRLQYGLFKTHCLIFEHDFIVLITEKHALLFFLIVASSRVGALRIIIHIKNLNLIILYH